jgi:hypothetical protein
MLQGVAFTNVYMVRAVAGELRRDVAGTARAQQQRVYFPP